MATAPPPRPTFTDRLWSEEVARAEAAQPLLKDIAFQFSNGRQFERQHPTYSTPAPTPAP